MSKSLVNKKTFLSGVTCLTQSWFTHHAPRNTLTPDLEWLFHEGNEINRLARKQLGEGRLFLTRDPEPASAETKQDLTSGISSLYYEATFVAAGCVARADIVRKVAEGWEVIETKSGKTTDEEKEQKQAYLADLAYTTFVMTAAGFVPSRSLLLLLNPEYRLNGVAPLLVEVDVTAEVRQLASEFALMAPTIVVAAQMLAVPAGSLEHVCRKCEYFTDTCLGVGVEDHVFLLPKLLKSQFEKLRPHTRLSELADDIKVTPTQDRFLRAWRSGKPLVDHSVLQALDAIAWPRLYLDFENAQPAIPWFADSAPRAAVAFQYSLDVRHGPAQPIQHREYLATPGDDWRRELTERLLSDLGETGSILVYSHHEKTILNGLAAAFPDRAAAIHRVVERLVDLERLINAGYVHPGFRGRTSIKVVLPVVAPELDYDRLAIGSGMVAAGIFSLMQVGKYPSEARAQHRANLLTYCALDTLAMVRVHDALEQVHRDISLDADRRV